MSTRTTRTTRTTFEADAADARTRMESAARRIRAVIRTDRGRMSGARAHMLRRALADLEGIA